MFRSSVDPNKISLTIKGLAAFIPIMIIFLSYFNIGVGSQELQNIVDQLADLVLLVGSVVSLAITIWGGIRKLMVKFSK